MRKRRLSSVRGFTLIELMVVVTIIAILAALIVPALQRAQSKSMAMRCLSTARSIASTIRSYASNWDGWTSPDPEHFVKDFGYQLSSDEGYFGEPAGTWTSQTTSQSYQHAGKIKDFSCPVDEGPPRTSHIIPSSYAVTSFFAGTNIMNATMEANRMLAVREQGSKRHPTGSDSLERSYVFADLSSTLGYDGPVFPGATLRFFDRSSDAGIYGTAEGDLPQVDYETIHADRLYLDYRWAYMLQGRLDGAKGYPNDWNNANVRDDGHWEACIYGIDNAVARMDGFLQFPRNGNWYIQTYGYYGAARVSFGVSSTAGSPSDVADTTSFTWSNKLQHQWNDGAFRGPIQVDDCRQYYKFQFVYRGYPSAPMRQGRWYVLWACQDPATSVWDPAHGGATGEIIPGNTISRLP